MSVGLNDRTGHPNEVGGGGEGKLVLKKQFQEFVIFTFNLQNVLTELNTFHYLDKKIGPIITNTCYARTQSKEISNLTYLLNATSATLNP